MENEIIFKWFYYINELDYREIHIEHKKNIKEKVRNEIKEIVEKYNIETDYISHNKSILNIRKLKIDEVEKVYRFLVNKGYNFNDKLPFIIKILVGMEDIKDKPFSKEERKKYIKIKEEKGFFSPFMQQL